MKKISIIILSNDIGRVGKVIKVKSGYARNFLIPFRKAIYYNNFNLTWFNNKYVSSENILDNKLIEIEYLYNKMNSLPLFIIKMKSAEGGGLFGSVGYLDIQKFIYDNLLVKLSKKCILFVNGSIKCFGNHIVKINLSSSYVVNLKVRIDKIVNE